MLKMYQMRNGRKSFNARELYSLFQLRTGFATWFQSRITKYGLQEGRDYVLIPNPIVTSGRPKKDYLICLHVAIGLAFRENTNHSRRAMVELCVLGGVYA